MKNTSVKDRIEILKIARDITLETKNEVRDKESIAETITYLYNKMIKAVEK